MSDQLQIILKTNNAKDLKQIGATLTAEQLMVAMKKIPSDKISHLLARFSKDEFILLLQRMDSKNVDRLKNALGEPLLHHLTQFKHLLAKQLETLDAKLIALETKINAIDPGDLSRPKAMSYAKEINQISCDIDIKLSTIQTALGLCWNTSRLDLIEEIGNFDEQYLRAITNTLPRLIDLFQERLFTFFEDLYDDEPALEGLASFGVQCVEDYRDANLISSQDDDEKELLKRVDLKLKEKGLYSIQDLKDAFVFSRRSLKDFLLR